LLIDLFFIFYSNKIRWRNINKYKPYITKLKFIFYSKDLFFIVTKLDEETLKSTNHTERKCSIESLDGSVFMVPECVEEEGGNLSSSPGDVAVTTTTTAAAVTRR
jgi:hypothetical protein